jgi:uncharacterized phage-like protein YoqJ
MKVAFTGHRPAKLGGYDNTRNKRRWFLAEIDVIMQTLPMPIEIISGMALGVDQWAATYAITRSFPLHAYIPFEGQERLWPAEAQKKYKEILLHATRIKYICSPGYAAWKMMKRNEAMVDDCDLLIAVWDGSSGGTANCIGYATEIGKKIIRLIP